MTRFTIILVSIAAVTLATASCNAGPISAAAAAAANRPNSIFDLAASEVAGKPVSVWCENSWVAWIQMRQAAGLSPEGTGFTRAGGAPIVYLSPEICFSLYSLLARESIGTYHAARALLVLAHEAVHQRGIVNEGEADCTALPLLPGLAVRHFGVAETIAEPYTVKNSRWLTLTRTVKIDGRRVKLSRRVKVTSTTVATRQVANPWLARLATDAHRWHASSPAEYQGGC